MRSARAAGAAAPTTDAVTTAVSAASLATVLLGIRFSYGARAQTKGWKLRDPIARLKAHLSRSGIADAAFFDSVEAEGDELAARIRQGTLEMPDPDPASMFDHVYAEQTPPLAAQRAEFVRYHASFEGEK